MSLSGATLSPPAALSTSLAFFLLAMPVLVVVADLSAFSRFLRIPPLFLAMVGLAVVAVVTILLGMIWRDMMNIFFSFFYVSNSRAKMRSYRLSRDEASNDALHVGGCAIYISENLGGKGSQQQRRNVTNPNELAKNAQSGPPNLATTRTRIYTEKFRNLELYIAN